MDFAPYAAHKAGLAGSERELTIDSQITRRTRFDETLARRTSAMLGLDALPCSLGEPVPQGWHFPLLGCETAVSDLRPDGFPGLGIPMPKLDLPRVVAAGRSVQFNRPLLLGQELRRTSTIASVQEKTSASGPIAILTVTHEITQSVEPPHVFPAISENQTFVLIGSPYTAAATASPAVAAPTSIIRTIIPDETLLFQFSALSFNSHKIHLDRDFSRTVEGYPDLVVNGGIVTLMMTEVARLELGRNLRSFTLRNKGALFCNRPFHLAADLAGEMLRIVAIDDEGRIAAEMEAITYDV